MGTPDAYVMYVKHQVWNGMVATDEDAEYLTRVGQKFLREHRILVWITVIGASSAVASFAASLPTEVYISISAILGLTSLFTIVARFYEKSESAQRMAKECRALSRDWRKLWASMNTYDDHTVLLSRANALRERLDSITEPVLRELGNPNTELQEECVNIVHKNIVRELRIG